MSQIKVGVVDYGIAGNIYSIVKAVRKVGGDVQILKSKDDFNGIDKIVVPGVGSFFEAMSELTESGVSDKIYSSVKEKSLPVLGICLGMQILSKIGFEHEETTGLNLIDAEVRQIKCNDVLPHMGFNKINIQKSSALFDGITENDEFYFMHSFEVCNYTNVLSLTDYSGHTFVSSIEKDNLYGVQFHPEKSREAGLRIFDNFINKM